MWGQRVPGPAQHRSGPRWWPRGAVPACCGLGDCPWQGREAGAAGFLPLLLQRQQLRQRRGGARRAGTGTGSPGGGSGGAVWAGQRPSDHPRPLRRAARPRGATATPSPTPPGWMTPPGPPQVAQHPQVGAPRGWGTPRGTHEAPPFLQAVARLTTPALRSKSSWSSPSIIR